MSESATAILGGIVGLLVLAAFAIAMRGGDPTALTGLFKGIFTLGVFCVLALSAGKALAGWA